MWKKEILEEAIDRFNGDPQTASLLGGLYDNVYEFQRDGKPSILVLIPIATKDRNLLHSELQWISFLRKNGINVPRINLSKHGNSVEVINRLPFPTGVVSFQKVSGRRFEEEMETFWKPSFFEKWGETLGTFHSLGKKFQKENKSLIFDEWNEGEVFYRDLSFLDGDILQIWVNCINKISTFEQTEESYGISHNNFYHKKFFILSSGELLLFSLNHCKKHFYTYDIATSLYHLLKLVPDDDQPKFVRMFLDSFSRGYQRKKSLVADWQEQVFFFTMFRQLMELMKTAVFRQGEFLTSEQKEEFLQQKRYLNHGDYVFYWQKILRMN